MAVLGSELAVGAAELVDVGMRLGVTVEHRLVVAAIRALVALVRTRAVVTAQVVLEVMTQFGGERTSRTFEHLVRRHVLLASMYPQLLLSPQSTSIIIGREVNKDYTRSTFMRPFLYFW